MAPNFEEMTSSQIRALPFQVKLEESIRNAESDIENHLDGLREFMNLKGIAKQTEVLIRLYVVSFLVQIAQVEEIFEDRNCYQKMVDAYWERLIWRIDPKCDIGDEFHRIFIDDDHFQDNLGLLLSLAVQSKEFPYSVFTIMAEDHDYMMSMAKISLSHRMFGLVLRSAFHVGAFINLGISFGIPGAMEEAGRLMREYEGILEGFRKTMEAIEE